MIHLLSHRQRDGTLIEVEFEITGFKVTSENFVQDWSPGHQVVGRCNPIMSRVEIAGRVVNARTTFEAPKKRKRK